MELGKRLRQCGPRGEFRDREVDALLAGTRFVLEALKVDLLENEPEATKTIEAFETAIAGLPADMAAVANTDQTRVVRKRLEGG